MTNQSKFTYIYILIIRKIVFLKGRIIGGKVALTSPIKATLPHVKGLNLI
jgi:hypothetical protein